LKNKGQGVKRLVLAVAVIPAVILSSCGGPYSARKMVEPERKLSIASSLFDKGKYKEASVEYKDFLAAFAGDERSDFAQFRLAESYRLDGDYPLAAVEYRILINDYGYSEYVDDAFYLEGLCAFMQRQRPERDQSKTYEALGRINRFLQVFKDSPLRPEAEKTRDRIHDILGEKDFKNGMLYFSRKHNNAALLYLDKVISDYPSTIWAARSRYYSGRIAEMNGDMEAALKAYGESASSAFDFSEKPDAAARAKKPAGRDAGKAGQAGETNSEDRG